MKILVTGAKGFIGKNLVSMLSQTTLYEVLQYDADSDPFVLESYCMQAEFVFHLAGINRPEKEEEFMSGNFGFTSLLLSTLKKHGNFCPVLLSSSIQAVLDNAYGKSKLAGENILLNYSKDTGAKVFIYRFPNVFGKWCRPNYNSVIATFCNNIARNLPISINDPNFLLNLVYIDDVVKELINTLIHQSTLKSGYFEVPLSYKIPLKEIAELLYSFKESRTSLTLPDVSNDFTKKLYSTYLSYLTETDFSYPLKMNVDSRGSFTEFLRMSDRGQVSINISNPGIIKGNHWHQTKNEKFLVVFGKGVIRLRNVNSSSVLTYNVDGEKLTVVDIPPGYTHNIENLGDSEMVTIIWINEPFNSMNPDTIYLEV
jgi:UDP-2-acetamido-2,6-beta-L-arabino-hexul-4-ose reductase